jgi:hypothetical protein
MESLKEGLIEKMGAQVGGGAMLVCSRDTHFGGADLACTATLPLPYFAPHLRARVKEQPQMTRRRTTGRYCTRVFLLDPSFHFFTVARWSINHSLIWPHLVAEAYPSRYNTYVRTLYAKQKWLEHRQEAALV